jgi:tRNA(Ile)-lysidine synthase
MAVEQSSAQGFVQSVAGFIREMDLIAPRASVIAAVSGGADSVAMLNVLVELSRQEAFQYRLTVAHLNHLIRPDAGQDAEFVADLANRLGLPCIVEARDVPAEARRCGMGLEQAARLVRYGFLLQAARRLGATCVAVAHQGDDNVETVLDRLIRGTHIRGLSGMPARRALDEGICLVRPMLATRRSQVEAYLRGLGATWRTDSTNADRAMRRNFIRHELLPLLRERMNSRVDEALLRLAGAAGEVQAHLDREVQRALTAAAVRWEGPQASLDAQRLAAEDRVIRACVMRLVLERLEVPLREVDAQHLGDLAAMVEPDGPQAVTLSGGLVARREGSRIVIGPAWQETESPPFEIDLPCPGAARLGDGRTVTCDVLPVGQVDFHAHWKDHPPGVELLDADRVRGLLVCRSRRAGDAFVPLGAPGRQTVSDFLTNAKLPPQRRKEVVCVCDEAGIVYVAPLRIDERVKITPAAQRVLRIALKA